MYNAQESKSDGNRPVHTNLTDSVRAYEKKLADKSGGQLRKSTDAFRFLMLNYVCDGYVPKGEMKRLQNFFMPSNPDVDHALADPERATAAMSHYLNMVPGDILKKRMSEFVASSLPQILAYGGTVAAKQETVGMKPYDVQLLAAEAMTEGKVIELATGEGKTLVGALSASTMAMNGLGVHFMTANSYLAHRDAEWMGPLYASLGLKVGVIEKDENGRRVASVYHAEFDENGRFVRGGLVKSSRQEAYATDVVYGTVADFGHDYLFDNILDLEDMLNGGQVQRKFMFREKGTVKSKVAYAAFVDEADSIMVDDATTPLVISDSKHEKVNTYFDSFAGVIAALHAMQNSETSQYALKAKGLLQTNNPKDRELAVEYLLAVKKGDPEKYKRVVGDNNVLAAEVYEKEKELKQQKKLVDFENRMLYVVVDERGKSSTISSRGEQELINRHHGISSELFESLKPDAKEPKTLAERLGLDDALSDENEAKQYAEAMDKLNAIQKLVLARFSYKVNEDYVISRENQIEIIDKATGRPMPGRRFHEGLHPAIEAIEKQNGHNVQVQAESSTMASMTIQNFLLEKYCMIAGMTGTALISADEFSKIYKLDVKHIEPNNPSQRVEFQDTACRDSYTSLESAVRETAMLNKLGVPVLLGTTSIPESETAAMMLKKLGYTQNDIDNPSRSSGTFHVLNAITASELAREARIVEQAGELGAITVSTNMAGRGTNINIDESAYSKITENYLNHVVDSLKQGKSIVLDTHNAHNYNYLSGFYKSSEFRNAVRSMGAKAYFDKGSGTVTFEPQRKTGNTTRLDYLLGLHVTGVKRQESRRYDNQLEGRSARNGQPGSSHFYTAPDDKVWNTSKLSFEGKASKRQLSRWERIKLAGQQYEAEGAAFEQRKRELELDMVPNKQREKVYRERDQLLAHLVKLKLFNDHRMGRNPLDNDDFTEWMYYKMDIIKDVAYGIVETHAIPGLFGGLKKSKSNLDGLVAEVDSVFGIKLNPGEFKGMKVNEIKEFVYEKVDSTYKAMLRKMKSKGWTLQKIAFEEMKIIFEQYDQLWKDYVPAIDSIIAEYFMNGTIPGLKDQKPEVAVRCRDTLDSMFDRAEYLMVDRIFDIKDKPLVTVSKETDVDGAVATVIRIG